MSFSDITLLFNSISWREPLWALLAFIPFVSLLLNISLQGKKYTYADKHLLPWVTYQQSTGFFNTLFSKNSAYVFAWVLIGVALAGPRLPLDRTIREAATDIDIMLVVDVSRSMHATDIAPSRLRRAQIEIEEFLGRVGRTRIGVVVFAARPHLFVPLTSDHEALRYYLQSLDNLTLPTNGSDPIAALKFASSEFTSSDTPSAIILLSDGDFPELSGSEFTSDFTQADIPVYALGIGSQEGEAIPLENGEWLQHEGRPVISRLNERNLQALLERRNGRGEGDLIKSNLQNSYQTYYSLATDDDRDWQKIYNEGIAKLAVTSNENSGHGIIWDELFYWPLSSALILLWISLIPFSLHESLLALLKGLGRRLSGKPAHQHYQPGNIKTDSNKKAAVIIILITTVIGVGLYPHQNVLATGQADSTNTINSNLNATAETNKMIAFKKYNNADYSAAAGLYKNITGYEARLGEGACYYKLEDYNSAVRQFGLASLAANNDNERAIALFNLGNAYFWLGDYAQAETVFSDALLYNPGQKNIQHNLEFSIALKKAVEDRLRTTSPFSRMGSGPQLAPSSEVIENNQGGSLSIDQSDSPLLKELPLPELADISDADLEFLINKGLGKIRLAAEDSSTATHLAYTRKKLSVINARLMMSALEDQQIKVWKRLFEMEEGFPAPLTGPRDIPGVAPW